MSGLPPQAPEISFSASFVSSLRGCVFSHQATVLFSPVCFISARNLRVSSGEPTPSIPSESSGSPNTRS